jgi:transcriptional regulator with XRE-family HTH domain
MTPAQMREQRSDLGLTQTELAERLGVTLRAVQYYESGGRPVPRPVAILMRVFANERET